MTRRSNYPAAIAGVIVFCLEAAGCSSGKKAQPATRTPPAQDVGSTTAVGVVPGVAGGAFEETTTAVVTVSAVDVASRRVTLADDAGNTATFTARPEIRNLDRLRAGDQVSATINKRLVILARAGGGEPGSTYSVAVSPAQKAATPGGVIAETYESVATVAAIDTADRTVSLKFTDGRTHTVPARPDVDLSRYKVGDNVVIRVTSTLSVLVSRP